MSGVLMVDRVSTWVDIFDDDSSLVKREEKKRNIEVMYTHTDDLYH